MRLVEGSFTWTETKGFPHCEEVSGIVLSDGRKVIAYDGCDWKENPTKVLVKLTKRLNKLGNKKHELVEIADGSDTLWYGIVPYKIPT